jgi:putative MATE family efflux protein
VLASFIFNEAILRIFGANDEILELCQSYFFVLMLGIPFLGWAMMSNNVIRAEGKPKTAMLTLVIPAVANIVLDPVFIYYFEMGVEGAAWATTIGYWASGLYTLWFFLRNKSEIPLHLPNFKLDGRLVKEISSIGSVTLVRQASFSLLAVVLNNSLDHYGGTTALSIYGLIRGFTMFVAFPNIGIMQGLIPIVGFNHGAERWDRLKESVRLSTIWTSLTSLSLFLILAIFSEDMVHAFTDDPDLMSRTPRAMIITFMGLPTMGISFIAAAYFQAIGKTYPAMILTLARQGMFMIPLALILPLFMGLDGIWYSLPIGEVLAAIISGIWLWREMKKF